jgi:polyisoprenoid-binding protein YceI
MATDAPAAGLGMGAARGLCRVDHEAGSSKVSPVTLQSGSYAIGPENGSLTLNTYVGGMGKKMGHDLVFEAAKWAGVLDLNVAQPAASSVQITVDVESLRIIEAVGGLKTLSDKDKVEIGAIRAKTLQTQAYPEISLVSNGVSGDMPTLAVQGDMTITGNTKPVTLHVIVEELGDTTRITSTATVVQSDFGIKPYSKLGALKIKDSVDLKVVVTLPAS